MKSKLIAFLLGIVALLGGGAYLGSSIDGQANAYATTTIAAFANNPRMLKVGNCTLGAVVISSTTNAIFTIKNATSTTDIASTTVASFAASAANGTYLYDAELPRGCAVEAPVGFVGSYTITWK